MLPPHRPVMRPRLRRRIQGHRAPVAPVQWHLRPPRPRRRQAWRWLPRRRVRSRSMRRPSPWRFVPRRISAPRHPDGLSQRLATHVKQAGTWRSCQSLLRVGRHAPSGAIAGVDLDEKLVVPAVWSKRAQGIPTPPPRLRTVRTHGGEVKRHVLEAMRDVRVEESRHQSSHVLRRPLDNNSMIRKI